MAAQTQNEMLYDTPLEEVGLGGKQPASGPFYHQLGDGTFCLVADGEKQVDVDVEGVRFTLPMTQENLANAVRRVFDVDDASILGIGEIEREGLGRLSLIRNSQIDDLEQLNALSAIAADADSRTLDAAETWWRSVPEEDEKTPELAMALTLNAEEIAYEPYSVSMEELANPSDEARFGASVFSHIYGAPALAEFGWDIGRWGAYHANGTATLYENRAIYDDEVPNADLDQTGREEIAAAAVRIRPSVSPAANPDAPKFRVTFANAEGEEFGVTFPMDPAGVPELSDAITMGGERDYFLADIDADDEYIFRSPDCNLSDFFRGGGTLERLNHAAILLASLDGTDREIAAILLSRIPGQATALNAANAALWAADAPTLAYENAREGMSPEEKFGRTLYEVKYPDELGVEELRDADWNIARYGRDLEGYIMGCEGFSWTEGAYCPEPSEDDPERFEELAQGAIAHLREKAEFMGRSAAAENPHAITYQMLSRLKSDCDYFLGAGEGNEKHLWAKSADGQIAEMRRLLGTLPKGAEPEWLTPEDIDSYEQKMKGHRGEEATGSPEDPLDNYLQHRFGRTKVIDGEVSGQDPEATDNGMCWKDHRSSPRCRRRDLLRC